MNLKNIMSSAKLVLAIVLVGVFISIAFYVTSLNSLANNIY